MKPRDWNAIVEPCPFCFEVDCELVGGPQPCEGIEEFAAAMEELNEAPRIREPFRVGDRG